MKRCTLCGFRHNYASNRLCQECKAPLVEREVINKASDGTYGNVPEKDTTPVTTQNVNVTEDSPTEHE